MRGRAAEASSSSLRLRNCGITGGSGLGEVSLVDPRLEHAAAGRSGVRHCGRAGLTNGRVGNRGRVPRPSYGFLYFRTNVAQMSVNDRTVFANLLSVVANQTFTPSARETASADSTWRASYVRMCRFL